MENNLTIVIPAYNEEGSLVDFLPQLISFIQERKFKAIIVNDGSKDKTADILKSYSEHIEIVNHKVNRGYGGAIKSGILMTKTKYVITIDADGQHEFSDIDNLYSKAIEKDADMMIGSRKNQKSANWYRGLGKSIIRNIAKFLMPMNIYDLNSGMKLYNTELAKKYINLCPDTMAYSDIIALVFLNFRHLVIEEPITIKNRIAGESTIGTMTAVDTIKEIINIVVLFNPMKIFFPASVFLMIVSLAWGLPIVFQNKGVSTATMLGIVTSIIILFIGILTEQVSLIRKKQFIDKQ